jgi:CRP-like cAMP-binding protein
MARTAERRRVLPPSQRESTMPTKFHNRLLAALSQADLAILLPHLEQKRFETRYSFEERNRPPKEACFVESGIVSVVAKSGPDRQIEVGVIGCEGFTSLAGILGSDRSPNSVYAQVAGGGYHLTIEALRSAMSKSMSLSGLLLKYAHVFMIQAAQTALSNGRAHLPERLARWVLMAHDRVKSNDVPLTHGFLAIMLGVRRAGVTVALQALQSEGLIDASRGLVIVSDRKGLENFAGPSYGVPEAEYRRLIGGR